METIIKKWGNSLGVRIPSFIVKDLSLKDGSCVDIDDFGDNIVIKPKNKISLSQMLSNINEDNIHNEIETSTPMGNEIW